MTHKQIQRWLMRGAGVMTLAGLALVGWVVFVAISIPVAERGGLGVEEGPDGADEHQVVGDGPTLQQLKALAAIDLRRPLKDPPKVVVKPPPMQAQFLGTIYESANPDHSQALFQMPDRTQRFFKAGDVFQEPGGKVVIKHVGNQTATIVYRDEQRELTVASQVGAD